MDIPAIALELVIWMKKLSIFLIFLLAISAAYAIPFDVKYTPIKESIYANDTAQYLITLDTGLEHFGKFQFYTISANWDISPTLITYNSTEEEFVLEIVPLDDTLSGPNLVPVTFKSLDDGRLKVENIFIYLKAYNETPKEYVPNVLLTATMDSEIDPREPVTISLIMNNRNPLDLGDVRIIIDSEIFRKEFRTTLGPLDNKENSVLFGDINPLLEPKKYIVTVQLIDSKNRTIATSSKEVLVKSYSDISVEQTKKKGLFSSKEVLVLNNKGNDYSLKKVQTKKNFFERIFTQSSEKYRIENIDGTAYMVWEMQVKPSETKSIIVTTNYTILVIIIALILLGTIAYYLFRSPILLYKRAKIVAASEHGVSEIKVRLHVKNRSSKTIRNIKIIDKYPKIVQLEEESALGMLKPSRMISADKTHSLLLWNLEVLDPYEERLLTYKLKSQLNIVGNMRLPSGKVKFMTPAGERTYYSNDVTLLHKSEKHIEK